MDIPKRYYVFALILLLCLALAACSSDTASDDTSLSDASTAAGEPEQPSAAPAEAQATAPELGAVVTPSPEAAPDEGALPEATPPPMGAFAGASAALEGLSSYRFVTSFVFTGEDDGEIESGSIELSGAVMDADRKHFVWRDLGEDEEFQIIQLDDQAWLYQDGRWEAVPAMVADAMSQAVLIFAPSVVWGGLFGTLESDASFVGRETLDGIPALHYTSTYHQWAGYWEGELVDASGDVWIAEAGYPLRYDFAATGIDENGDRGSVSWTMQLSDVNADIVIEPPLLDETTY